MTNPKHEIRNPKQIQNLKSECLKHLHFRSERDSKWRLEHWHFEHWEMFRISGFGFRISDFAIGAVFQIPAFPGFRTWGKRREPIL